MTTTDVTADLADRNSRLTKRLAIFSTSVASVVLVPMLVLAAVTFVEMQSANSVNDPFAGLGLVIAAFVSAPVLLGTLVSGLGLVWARSSVGPMVAGVGLGINVMVALTVAWFWLPSLLV